MVAHGATWLQMLHPIFAIGVSPRPLKLFYSMLQKYNQILLLKYCVQHFHTRSKYSRVIGGYKSKSVVAPQFSIILQVVVFNCVCEVGTVGNGSPTTNQKSRVQSPAWSRVELWATFFRHTALGQGR